MSPTNEHLVPVDDWLNASGLMIREVTISGLYDVQLVGLFQLNLNATCLTFIMSTTIIGIVSVETIIC